MLLFFWSPLSLCCYFLASKVGPTQKFSAASPFRTLLCFLKVLLRSIMLKLRHRSEEQRSLCLIVLPLLSLVLSCSSSIYALELQSEILVSDFSSCYHCFVESQLNIERRCWLEVGNWRLLYYCKAWRRCGCSLHGMASLLTLNWSSLCVRWNWINFQINVLSLKFLFYGCRRILPNV